MKPQLAVWQLGLCLLLASTGCAPRSGQPGHRAKHLDTPVCHKSKRTLWLPENAARAHLRHGDSLGVC
ncbi:MAG: hypothetical protein KDD44_12275, partial [Bdellovibrionales bacterium]|nr:hypothetical protein [Bdellovibrionales bacterium]